MIYTYKSYLEAQNIVPAKFHGIAIAAVAAARPHASNDLKPGSLADPTARYLLDAVAAGHATMATTSAMSFRHGMTYGEFVDACTDAALADTYADSDPPPPDIDMMRTMVRRTIHAYLTEYVKYRFN